MVLRIWLRVAGREINGRHIHTSSPSNLVHRLEDTKNKTVTGYSIK